MFRLLLWSLCFILPITGFAGELTFPRHTPPVTDETRLLDVQTKRELSQVLASIENFQVEIAVLSSTRQTDIAEYGYQLGRYWGVGEKEIDNGILLIIVPFQHEVRLETGYGAEGVLTDAQARLLLEEQAVPYFRKGEIKEGILNTVTHLAALLEDRSVSGRIDSQPPSALSLLKQEPPEKNFLTVGGLLLALAVAILICWLFWEKTRNLPARKEDIILPSRDSRLPRSNQTSLPSNPKGGGSFGGGGAGTKW